MASSLWEIDGHRVGLTHDFWSGAATISVDDTVIFRRPVKVADSGFAHRFDVGRTPVAVRVVADGFKFRHEILTGEKAVPVVESNWLPLERPLVVVGALAAVFAVGLLVVVAMFVFP